MKKILFAVSSAVLPVISFAAGSANGNVTDLTSLLSFFNKLVNIAIPLMVTVAVIVVMYGVLGYILNAGDEEKRGDMKNYIVYGIVGIFIMVSIYGLVRFLGKTFGFENKAFTTGQDVTTADGQVGVPVLPSFNN